MEILNLVQGTPEWHAVRAKRFGASDAPVMMGAASYKTRTQLLDEKATGISKEETGFQQRIFANGHRVEDHERSIVEQSTGEELYQAVVTDEIEGLPLLASLDGHDLLMTFILECKQWNKDKAALMAESGTLLPEYFWQTEHQLLVSKAERCIFVMSDGMENGKRLELEYYSVPERRAALIAGWKQFTLDLSTHVPVAVIEKPEATPVADLPALFVDVEGEVKGTNLATFKQSAEALIKSVKTELVTDQDFADAELVVKKFGEAEKSLDDAKKQALAKTESIDEFFREVDHLKELFRQKRLELDKLVKAEKEARKSAIVSGAKAALAAHYEKSVELCAGIRFVSGYAMADFAGAVKGKRNLQSMQEAVDQLLADQKVGMNQLVEKIMNNLSVLEEVAGEFHFLFPDHCGLVLKDQSDMIATVKLRIAEHEAEQRRKAEETKAREARAAEDAARASQTSAPVMPSNNPPTQPIPSTEQASKPRYRAGFNQHGVDTGYVAQRLQEILRDLNNYKPDGLARALVDLSNTVTTQAEAA